MHFIWNARSSGNLLFMYDNVNILNLIKYLLKKISFRLKEEGSHHRRCVCFKRLKCTNLWKICRFVWDFLSGWMNQVFFIFCFYFKWTLIKGFIHLIIILRTTWRHETWDLNDIKRYFERMFALNSFKFQIYPSIILL